MQVDYFDLEPINTSTAVSLHFTPFDLKRLDSYSQNLLDYHVILDLIPTLASLYCLDLLSNDNSNEQMRLSAVQAAIFVSLGLQRKTVEDCEQDLGLPVSQILAMFGKAVRKISQYFSNIVEQDETQKLDTQIETTKSSVKVDKHGQKALDDDRAWDPSHKTLEQDLNEAADEAMTAFREKQKEIINSLALDEYAIGGTEQDWKDVKINGGSNRVSIKNEKSTKKRKHQQEQGLSDKLASQHRTGLSDPKGLESKIKQKKLAKKQKKDSKK